MSRNRLAMVDNDPLMRQTAIKAIGTKEGQWLLELHSDYSSFLRSVRPGANRKGRRVKKMDSLAVVLLATSIGGTSCLQYLHKVSIVLPDVPILLLGGPTDSKQILEFVVAGACGLLRKPVPAGQLFRAVKRAAKGWHAFSHQAQSALLQALRPSGGSLSGNLTLRQKEVLALLFHGLSYKEIGSALGIAVGSVHTHLSLLYKKLGAHNREEAIQKFLHQIPSSDETLCE